MSFNVSFSSGRGNINHNEREFSTPNVNRNLSKNNVDLKSQDLNAAYEEVFGESCEINNERQKREDRKLSPDQYLKKIENGQGKKNNPKPFYEVVVQIGNMNDSSILNHPEQAEKAKEVLQEYFHEFEKNNPNIHVFNAKIHMDEKTPHMHIDFIPVADGYKTGMPKRNSYSKALEQQGCTYEGQNSNRNNSRIVWQDREKDRLVELCRKNGIEAKWEKQEISEKHLSVAAYKKLAKINDRNVEQIKKQLEKMSYFEFVKRGKDKAIETLAEIENAKKGQNRAFQEQMKVLTENIKKSETMIMNAEIRKQTINKDIDKRIDQLNKDIDQLNGEIIETNNLHDAAERKLREVAEIKKENEYWKSLSGTLEKKEREIKWKEKDAQLNRDMTLKAASQAYEVKERLERKEREFNKKIILAGENYEKMKSQYSGLVEENKKKDELIKSLKNEIQEKNQAYKTLDEKFKALKKAEFLRQKRKNERLSGMER